MSDLGILYVATGQKCLNEAILNASISRRFCKNIPIALTTDLVQVATSAGVFDLVHPHLSPRLSYRDKISALVKLPFDQTLYLDSDAFLAHPIDPLFSMGLVSDFAATSAPVRHPPGWSDSVVPISFPEFNSGVMLFSKSHQQRRLVIRWLKLYDKLKNRFDQDWDQASLRSVIWHSLVRSKIQVSTLSPEFNLRTTKPWIAGRGMPVFVIHGRFERAEIPSFINYLNNDIDKFRTVSEWMNLHPSTSIRPMFDRSSPA